MKDKNKTKKRVVGLAGAAAGGAGGFSVGATMGIAAPGILPLVLGGSITAISAAVPLAAVGAGAGYVVGKTAWQIIPKSIKNKLPF